MGAAGGQAWEPSLSWSGQRGVPGRGRVQHAGGVGGWGVGARGGARERVRGMCSRLVKLEVRQWVAFRDETKGETHVGSPRKAGWDWLSPRHRAVPPKLQSGRGVPEYEGSVFSVTSTKEVVWHRA